jgi:hypothetical protein
MKITLFWVVTQCRLMDRSCRLEGTYCLHIHPGNGTRTFLRIVGNNLPTTWLLVAKFRNFQIQCRDNLKPPVWNRLQGLHLTQTGYKVCILPSPTVASDSLLACHSCGGHCHYLKRNNKNIAQNVSIKTNQLNTGANRNPEKIYISVPIIDLRQTTGPLAEMHLGKGKLSLFMIN